MAEAIRFILNGEERTVGNAPPAMTVLDWLRGREHLTGTKEGCAEGDCGACTVVLGEAVDGKMRYRAINACLALVGQLDGKVVLTVEGLEGADGTLHPVQQALVDTDGTQCGYCTPGFVMALFALYHAGEPADDDVIHDALAGNLCRCTGYRPIVDAARRTAAAPADRFRDDERELINRTSRLPVIDEVSVEGRTYFVPATIEALAALRRDHPDAVLWAGGTDLGLRVSKDREIPDTVISTARVSELLTVEETATHLEIGAAVTYTDALPAIRWHFPAMADLIERIGSRQIRNLGTIGGNVGNASPIGDTPPCLIALDAIIVLRSADGRREIPAEDMFVAYRRTAMEESEFIEKIRIPYLSETQSFHAYKVSKRFDQDISAVIGAFRLDLQDGTSAMARIAYGGMAETPKRAAECEWAIAGNPWTEATVVSAATALTRDFAPITDFRASAAYRTKVAANLLIRLFAETSGGVETEVAAL